MLSPNTNSGAARLVLQTLTTHPVHVTAVVIVTYILFSCIYLPLIASPLRRIPGPKAYALTKWRLALDDYRGERTRIIHAFHQQYGTAVRVGPCEVSFSSLSALRTIYGAGSGFDRTDYYRMFDVYGYGNLFSFPGTKAHAQRKKLLAHAYSKSMILSPTSIARPLIEKNVKGFLDLLEQDKAVAEETFRSLHWFSLDSITGFLYGDKHGGTHALRGNESDRALLNDIINHGRRKLSWFNVHLRAYSLWVYSATGPVEKIITRLGLLPMNKPATNTGIRTHALKSWNDFEATGHEKITPDDDQSIMSLLWRYNKSEKGRRLDGLEIASEVADHFLAGIDTTSDTLMYVIWSLSRPENRAYQEKLIAELDSIPASDCNDDGNPTAEVADKLPYLDAVIKEALRMYAPIPAMEPRSLQTDTVIDGYRIPAGTIVGVAPYTLHRNPDVFPQPLKFKPERWLGECGDPVEMKKWFWAFSSGGRMCIGLQYVFFLPRTSASQICERC